MEKESTWRRRSPSTVFSLFVSNLPTAISKTELEAMFCRAGKVVNSFIPVERATGKQRGFGFVEFRSEREAKLGIEIVSGRSWVGQRIQADFAHPHSSNRIPTTFAQKQISPFCHPSTTAWGRPNPTPTAFAQK